VKRGEVRWYRFRDPDKKRPVVILTRDTAIEFLNDVTVVPITSTIRGAPSEVLLDDSDGMRHECAANLYYLQTVPKNRVGGLITTLSSDRMAELRTSLLFALGF
jgi:mRNA interferase MazF